MCHYHDWSPSNWFARRLRQSTHILSCSNGTFALSMMTGTSTSSHCSNRFDANRPILQNGKNKKGKLTPSFSPRTFISMENMTYLEYLWGKLAAVVDWYLWSAKCIHFRWFPVAVSSSTRSAYRTHRNQWPRRSVCWAALSIRRSHDWPEQFRVNCREILDFVRSTACGARTGSAPALFVRCPGSCTFYPTHDRMHGERHCSQKRKNEIALVWKHRRPVSSQITLIGTQRFAVKWMYCSRLRSLVFAAEPMECCPKLVDLVASPTRATIAGSVSNPCIPCKRMR